MPMTRKQKIEYVKEVLDSFAKLERKVGDEVSWIALKLSCTQQEAEKLIQAARKNGATAVEVRPATENSQCKNLFADIPQNLPKELVQALLTTAHVRIERIVSHGHASPEGFWYDQEQHEWVVVLKGAARLRFEERTVEMKPGDFINIAAHEKHRVEWTTPDEPTVWLGVRYGD